MQITFNPRDPSEVASVRRFLDLWEPEKVKESAEVVQLAPWPLHPSLHQQLHVNVANYLQHVVRPVTVNEITEYVDSDTTLVANSLQHLKDLGLVELTDGKYSRKWVATELLRNRGVIAV